MNSRVPWVLILAALLAVLAAPFLLRPREERWDAEERLQVVSPHWEGIRYEFRHGFREWYRRETGRKVDVEWLDIGGASDIMRYLESEFSRQAEGGRLDLVYGGGADFFVRLKKKGFLQTYTLPPEILAAVPKACGGVELYDPDHSWYGAALSGFGLIYNKAILKNRGLSVPGNWEDLGRPELSSWVGAADPGKSGSVHMMFEIVLQAYGWEKGMDLISRMGGNARYFADGGSDIVQDVALGEVAIGMCIDFYAGAKIAEVGSDLIGFLLPEGLTVINPDPIGILKGAPHGESARAFVRYAMSRPGQQLWMYRQGAPGGPRRFGLARLGVMPEIYADDPQRLLVESNPFPQKPGLVYDSARGGQRWQVLNDFLRAAIIDTHEDAVKAWGAVIRRQCLPGDLRRFAEMPLTEEDLMALSDRWKDAEFRERTRMEWVRWFRSKYLDIAKGHDSP